MPLQTYDSSVPQYGVEPAAGGVTVCTVQDALFNVDGLKNDDDLIEEGTVWSSAEPSLPKMPIFYDRYQELLDGRLFEAVPAR